MTSVVIKALTYPGLMANRHDSNHYNTNEVEDAALTRAEFHQFREERQQNMRKIQQRLLLILLGNHITTIMINIFKNTLLTTRKIHSLMEISVSWILLTSFLIWKSILIFGRFVMKKIYNLHLIYWAMK